MGVALDSMIFNLFFFLFNHPFFWGSPLMETSWCLSDEHRVVLGPSAQDADGALQLVVAASAESFPGMVPPSSPIPPCPECPECPECLDPLRGPNAPRVPPASNPCQTSASGKQRGSVSIGIKRSILFKP